METMEKLKELMPVAAVLWPLAVCFMLALRVCCNRQTDWKLATCLSALTIATSLLLLLASEKLLFLKYQDAVLQVNQKAEEVRKLTEQNKRVAKAAAQALASGLNGVIATERYDSTAYLRSLEKWLQEAGVSASEIEEVLGRGKQQQKQ
jgi:hypothetical protein